MHVNLITQEHKDSNKTSVTEYSSISNLMIKKDNWVRIATTFSTLFLMIAILLSIFFSFFFRDKRILTFHYETSGNNISPDVFHTNLYIFYIFLMSLVILNFYSVYFIFREQEVNFLKIIFSDLKWFFISSQFLLGLSFIIGIAFEKGMTSLIISFSSNILCIIFILFYYKSIKRKQNLCYPSFICCSLYNSIIFSFLTYVLLFNLSELLIFSFRVREKTDDRFLEIFSIGSYSSYSLVAIILLAYFKDVVYSFVMIYFMFGFFVNKNFNWYRTETLVVLVLIAFSFVASLVTIIKYGKTVFGYESEDHVTEVLNERANHKKSSWFYVGQN